ncbi:MAG: hypothetical protein ACLFV7_02815 [Phycisphaerae bacterium]
MHKIKFLAAGLLATSLLLTTGCSDNPSRKANRELKQEVNKAQRLLSQAQNLLEAPVIEETATGKVVPLPDVDVDPNSVMPGEEAPVRLTDSEQINPNAVNLLTQAIDGLVKAIDAHAGADPEYTALARSVLARLYEQKGYVQTRQADRIRSSVYADVGEARSTLSQVVEQDGMLEYYRQILALSDEDVKSMKEEAQQTASTLKGRKATLEGKIEDLQQKKNQLQDKKDKLEANARALRSEARAPGKKGNEAELQALKVMDEVSSLETQISKLDYEISGLKMDVSEVEMKLSIATAKINAADRILTRREEGVDPSDPNSAMGGRKAVRRQRQQLLGQREQTLARAKDALTSIAQGLDKLDAAQNDASTAYDAAARNYREYGSLDEEMEMDALAQRAATLMAMGRAKIRQVYLFSELESLLGVVASGWPDGAPSQADAIRQKLTPAIAEIRKSGSELFAEAADLYSRASRQAEREYRWLYEGGQAKALIGQAEVSAEPRHLDTASTVLRGALDGRSEAPAVTANVGELQQEIAAVRARIGG